MNLFVNKLLYSLFNNLQLVKKLEDKLIHKLSTEWGDDLRGEVAVPLSTDESRSTVDTDSVVRFFLLLITPPIRRFTKHDSIKRFLQSLNFVKMLRCHSIAAFKTRFQH